MDIEQGLNHAKGQKDDGPVLGRFGQDIAGPGSEQGFGGTSPKGYSKPGFLPRQLHQDDQDQKQPGQNDEEIQNTDNQSHSRFLMY